MACAAAWSSAHERRLQEGSISGWDASLVALGGNESFDWTFTTPYAGSVSPEQPWRAVDERIDRSLLVARDPILFYNELTLYESELDDNGTMSLTVKVRVMPACWFVLLRYWSGTNCGPFLQQPACSLVAQAARDARLLRNRRCCVQGWRRHRAA